MEKEKSVTIRMNECLLMSAPPLTSTHTDIISTIGIVLCLGSAEFAGVRRAGNVQTKLWNCFDNSSENGPEKITLPFRALSRDKCRKLNMR